MFTREAHTRYFWKPCSRNGTIGGKRNPSTSFSTFALMSTNSESTGFGVNCDSKVSAKAFAISETVTARHRPMGYVAGCQARLSQLFAVQSGALVLQVAMMLAQKVAYSRLKTVKSRLIPRMRVALSPVSHEILPIQYLS